MSDQMSTTLNGKSDVIQSELKIKKVRDKTGWKTGWKTEWSREGRDKMVKNLVSIFNRVEKERNIPKQERETTIKSIYKEGLRENLSKTQRAIFIMNTISKAYERETEIQNEMRRFKRK